MCTCLEAPATDGTPLASRYSVVRQTDGTHMRVELHAISGAGDEDHCDVVTMGPVWKNDKVIELLLFER